MTGANRLLLERVRWHLDRAQEAMDTLLDEFVREEKNRFDNYFVSCRKEANRHFWQLWSILGHALLEYDAAHLDDEESD